MTWSTVSILFISPKYPHHSPRKTNIALRTLTRNIRLSSVVAQPQSHFSKYKHTHTYTRALLRSVIQQWWIHLDPNNTHIKDPTRPIDRLWFKNSDKKWRPGFWDPGFGFWSYSFHVPGFVGLVPSLPRIEDPRMFRSLFRPSGLGRHCFWKLGMLQLFYFILFFGFEFCGIFVLVKVLSSVVEFLSL